MDSTLRITLIANAGLLMTYRGTTLMIDGIYGREGHPFSNLSPEVWREMLGSEDRFQKVDYLLFTHAHPDHFSPEMTGEFLRHRDVKGLFLPQPHTAADGACGLPHRAGDHRPGLPDAASGPEVPGRAPFLLHSDIR